MARPLIVSSSRLIMRTMMNPTYTSFGFRNETPRRGITSLPPYLISTSSGGHIARRYFSVYCGCSHKPAGGAPVPSRPPPSSWRNWIIGTFMTVIVPFFTHKWSQLLLIKEQVDQVVETTEKIIDVVEDVAETVDKVAEDIADELPEGGKLKIAVDFVEDIAEEIAKDAHMAGEFIDKFEEVEDKVEAILIEPVKHLSEELAKETS